jgi:chemotaxis protein MotA
MCYGFLSPLASNMMKLNDADSDYIRCLRMGVIAFVKGSPPILAIEFARRSVPGELRPTFKEMEAACRGGAAANAEKK